MENGNALEFDKQQDIVTHLDEDIAGIHIGKKFRVFDDYATCKHYYLSQRVKTTFKAIWISSTMLLYDQQQLFRYRMVWVLKKEF